MTDWKESSRKLLKHNEEMNTACQVAIEKLKENPPDVTSAIEILDDALYGSAARFLATMFIYCGRCEYWKSRGWRCRWRQFNKGVRTNV